MKTTRPLRLLLAATVLLLTSVSSAHAQGFGTIVGTLTDPAGSVVPNAKVTVTDQGTQIARVVTSNDQGYFVVPALRPSTYTVTANAQGFAIFSQKDVTLLTDQSLTVDMKLTLGETTQTVNVETNVVQVDTTSSTISQVVEQRRIVDLPLNGRNAVSLATLVPGTIQAPANNAD